MCTHTFYDQCHIFSIKCMYCKVISNVLYGSFEILSAVFDFTPKKLFEVFVKQIIFRNLYVLLLPSLVRLVLGKEFPSR